MSSEQPRSANPVPQRDDAGNIHGGEEMGEPAGEIKDIHEGAGLRSAEKSKGNGASSSATQDSRSHEPIEAGEQKAGTELLQDDSLTSIVSAQAPVVEETGKSSGSELLGAEGERCIASAVAEGNFVFNGGQKDFLSASNKTSVNENTKEPLSPGKPRAKSPSPPPPPPKDEKFLNPQSASPTTPRSPNITPLNTNVPGKGLSSEPAKQVSPHGATDERTEEQDDSQSEIQSIMEQFDDGKEGLKADDIMSPRFELAGPLSGLPIHPPRKSSLEAAPPGSTAPSAEDPLQTGQAISSPPPRSSSLMRNNAVASANEKAPSVDHTASPRPASMFKSPPPEPDPEPDLPFDFHRFLEQLRHRTADPVAKYLRSFLLEFGKKQWMVHEQVKIISDFLIFISKRMAQCEIWRTVSDAEFDNAREGMEKLVMNRLYTQTFSPAIPPPPPQGAKGTKRPPQEHMIPGRRGQHQEDVERDEVLAQKVRIYSWVREEHLDIKPINEKGRKFLVLAQQELLKIKSYRAPRDKIICVLNCCKVIFGFLRNSQTDQSADSFVPLLIYTVLRANPEHLVSNVQYILRFRNQEKLGGEAGYYISSLMGAVQFIESLDRTSLTISDDEFEANVEAAVSAIAERHTASSDPTTSSERDNLKPTTPQRRPPSPLAGVRLSEKSTISQPEVTPRNSLDAERSAPRLQASRQGSSAGMGSVADTDADDNAAVAGLLRTIQKPLSTIGRIFSDEGAHQGAGGPAQTPQPGASPRVSPAPPLAAVYPAQQRQAQAQGQRPPLSAEDAAARQASAEVEEARRLQRQEHRVVVDTLAGMFPNLDRDVIDDVVRVKDGRVGLAVDACLALSN